MENTLLCVLLLLSILIYCGHCGEDDEKPVLTIQPNSTLYPGETVTLTCSVESDSIWNYQWFKDRNDNVVSQSVRHTITGDTLTISRAAESDQDLYWCQGEIQSRSISSIISDPVTITLHALPRASVSISPRGLLYSGDTVTLQCDIPDYTDWSRAGVSDQGQYWCEGNRASRPTSSQPNSHPTATLSSDKEDVFTGDSVTLSCTVESSGWKFYWYRHRPDSTPVTTTSGYSYTLSWVSVSDGGQYWCRAGRGDPVYYNLYSDPVQINITDI
eukprot:XP_014012057.1 PREDICTED: Fc receptor-like protein 5 [Salmo salar]